jgi:site-specific recombinase XerC
MKVGSYRQTGTHRVIEVLGKGGRERRVPLHAEAVERIEAWLDAAGIRDDLAGALFRPPKSPRGNGRDGFAPRSISRRAV